MKLLLTWHVRVPAWNALRKQFQQGKGNEYYNIKDGKECLLKLS